MELEKVVPFGRSLDEYRHMFALSDQDLNKTIIGVADGPASFNAEMSSLGKSVVSVDPLYIFSAEAIENQFNVVVDNIIDQVRATPNDWVWTYHQSPDHLKANRVNVLNRFVADFDKAKHEGRYIVGELPAPGFAEQSFELALCSHFLFLYSDHLSYDFHRDSILAMARIAREVRIFPLLTLALNVSPYVPSLIEEFTSMGYEMSVEKVPYELQRGGNEMLRIRKSS